MKNTLYMISILSMLGLSGSIIKDNIFVKYQDSIFSDVMQVDDIKINLNDCYFTQNEIENDVKTIYADFGSKTYEDFQNEEYFTDKNLNDLINVLNKMGCNEEEVKVLGQYY